VAANDEAGRTGDWSKMSQFYTEDAIYSWNNGQNWEFVATRPQADPRVGVRQRDGRPRALGLSVRAHADRRPEGRDPRRLAPDRARQGRRGQAVRDRGHGGSWFRYAGNFQWDWQRDFFDHINAGTVFGAMMKNNQLKPKMVERLQKGSKMPGWTRRSDFDWYDTIADREA
jgi:hypothetical protein